MIQRLAVALVIGVTGTASLRTEYFWLGVLLVGLSALHVARAVMEVYRDR